MDTLKFRRRAHTLHRWLGLIVGLQVFVWLMGGLVMTALPIERVRSEHKIAVTAPLPIDPGAIIPFEAAASAAGANRVAAGTLGTHLGQPAWRITGPDGERVLIDARSGLVLSPLDESQARAVAAADYAGPGRIAEARLLSEPPTEYGRAGPVWQVVFDDTDGATLYIAPDTGEVRARRGRTWRVFDFAWRLHVMDYDDGENFNHPLVQGAAGAGTLFAISGLALVGLRLRRGGYRGLKRS